MPHTLDANTFHNSSQLFGLSIDYTFWNWLAVIVLAGVLKAERNDK